MVEVYVDFLLETGKFLFYGSHDISEELLKTDEISITNLMGVLSEVNNSVFSISAVPIESYPFSRVIVQPDLPSHIVKSGGWVE